MKLSEADIRMRFKAAQKPPSPEGAEGAEGAEGGANQACGHVVDEASSQSSAPQPRAEDPALPDHNMQQFHGLLHASLLLSMQGTRTSSQAPSLLDRCLTLDGTCDLFPPFEFGPN